MPQNKFIAYFEWPGPADAEYPAGQIPALGFDMKRVSLFAAIWDLVFRMDCSWYDNLIRQVFYEISLLSLNWRFINNNNNNWWLFTLRCESRLTDSCQCPSWERVSHAYMRHLFFGGGDGGFHKFKRGRTKWKYVYAILFVCKNQWII